MKLMIKTTGIVSILFVCIFLMTFIHGCGNKDDVNTETGETHTEVDEHSFHTEDETKDKHEGEVALSEEQIKIMDIQLVKIENQNIDGYIKANGEIMINPDNESKVGGIIPGRVKKIYVKEGSYVKAGQTLAIIENPDLIDVQVDYINAKNDFEFARQEYDRQKKLNIDNIGSKKNLAEIESNYKRALANYKTLEEKLSTYRISKNRFDNIYQDTVANLQRTFSITAPISGSIVSRMITVGQYVEPSMDMFHIVNTSTVFVDLSIFEKDLPFVNVGQKVIIEMSTASQKEFEGKISYINKVFDDKNRTVKVRVSISNKSQELYPFMFVTAKIYVNDGNVLAVPVTAIETEGESKYIFVKTDERKKIEIHEEHAGEEEHKEGEDEHKEGEAGHKENEDKHNHTEGDEHSGEAGIVFKKIRVNTGISDDKYVEIIPFEELSQGAEVVSKGTFYFKSELMKEELGEHNH
ncbi:MAG: efflux RND transporter periplasmic adaptor subunit [Ignavibacteria bacterium]